MKTKYLILILALIPILGFSQSYVKSSSNYYWTGYYKFYNPIIRIISTGDTLATKSYARSVAGTGTGGSSGTMIYPSSGIPISTASGWATSIANNSSNWNTAYSWGNHAGIYAPVSTVSFPGFGTTGTTACIGNDSRLSNARPASDVSAWAKAASKPTYTYTEVGAQVAGSYLTSLTGAVLTSQSTPQTIGLTGSRLAKLWATDITVTNAITGSITGNAGTVTNGVYTSRTVNGHALSANVTVTASDVGAISLSDSLNVNSVPILPIIQAVSSSDTSNVTPLKAGNLYIYTGGSGTIYMSKSALRGGWLKIN